MDSKQASKAIPFDCAKLDDLLEAGGIDVAVATSKHNVQYLLGGYRFFFFEHMEAIGVSRYLPIVIYPKGRPQDAAYIGYRLEAFERELGKFWMSAVRTSSSGTTDAIRLALEHIRGLGTVRAVGVEPAFLPMDAANMLRDGLGDCELIDAQFPLERLRACKTASELDRLRRASDGVVAAMLAAFAAACPGMTKAELVETLRREEVGRGLEFDYCLVTAGSNLNRSPSEQRLAAGDILSLDSGGSYRGYIGDLCRMGILGEPDVELVDLLAAVDEIQHAARGPIRRGCHGRDIFTAAQQSLTRSKHREYTDFVAHGMGLVSHEAPRLTSGGPVAYRGHDADQSLQSGMVISIETTMRHPKRGFIKLEDTVAVTERGWDAMGDVGRGWNRAGRPRSSVTEH